MKINQRFNEWVLSTKEQILAYLTLTNLLLAFLNYLFVPYHILFYVIDLPTIFPFDALFPSNPIETGLHRWSLCHLPRPKKHVFISNFILILSKVVIPLVLYQFGIIKNTLWCVCIGCVIEIGLYSIYFSLWPDPFVFGPHEKNIVQLGVIYSHQNKSKNIDKRTKETNDRITVTIFYLGVFNMIYMMNTYKLINLISEMNK